MHRIALAFALVAVAACDQRSSPPAPARTAPPVPAPAPAAAAAPAAAPGGAATFGHRAPAVGDRAEEKTAMVMTMTMGVTPAEGGAAQEQAMELREDETRLEEVLATSGDAVTRLKVTYAARTETTKEDGKETARPSPLPGKTFVVEARDGRITVTTEAGKPAPVAAARHVQESLALLGKPDPILTHMPRRPLVPGAPVPELVAAIKEEIAAKAKEMPVERATVTFARVAGDEGVFEITLELVKLEKPTRLALSLAGELRVKLATSAITAFTLKGPLQVAAAPGEKAKITGSGRIELQTARRPL